METIPKERQLYIDNLRLLMIMLVVVMHAAVTYSGMGSWYYIEKTEIGTLSTILFGLYQSFTQAYFMGFLFFISGYFVPAAYDKKGFSKFVKDRLIRLGIPTLVYMLIIHPVIIYFVLKMSWLQVRPSFLSYYGSYITSLDFVGSTGPLWFALALLIFTIIYAAVRRCSKKNTAESSEKKLDFKMMIKIILIISAAAFLVRIVQPIDTDILNMQLSFFSQYVVLFIAGIMAYRNQWFSNLEYKFGIKWLKAALGPGVLIWIVVMIAGGALDGKSYFKGGLHWQSAVYALWESFTAVAMSAGLIALFREKYNHQGKWIKKLSDNAFTVYVFHAPILIAAGMMMREAALPPLVKWVILSLIGLAMSFGFAQLLIRHIPILKNIL